MTFEDGSFIEWADRESLRYTEPGYVALLWVDYEPGFFNRGRVLMMKSLCRWHEAPAGEPLELSSNKQEEIVEKVRKYYGSRSLRLSDDA
jgi:hypothetical protein